MSKQRRWLRKKRRPKTEGVTVIFEVPGGTGSARYPVGTVFESQDGVLVITSPDDLRLALFARDKWIAVDSINGIGDLP